MLLYSWDRGLDVCVVLTGSSPLTQTGMVNFVPEADTVTLLKRIRKFSMAQDIGARVAAHIFNRISFAIAKGRKRGKYMAKCAISGYEFLPFSFSSLGELEADTVTLLKRIRKFSMAQDIGARVAAHIFNRISFAIAKGAWYLDDGSIIGVTLVVGEEDPRSKLDGVFLPNIARPLHGVKLLELPRCYDDGDDEERSNSLKYNIISGLPPCFAITPNEPVLSIEEPDNSLSMGDEHLDTILAMESDEVIKSSVEDLILIPSKSKGIPEHMCDVPFHDNYPPLDVSKYQIEDLSESNDEFSSIDDNSFSFDKIDYVEASPLNSELVSSEVMEIVIPEVGGIDDDILLTIKDDILREKLLNVNHLFAKIEASNNNPILFYDPIISGTPPTLTTSGKSDFFLEGDILLLEAFLNDDHSSDFKTKSSSTSLNSLLEETNNFDNSLPEFTTFSNVLFDAEYEYDSNEFAGELTLLKSISPGIDETDYDFKGDIRLIKRLLYDNSSPRPSEEFVSANSDAKIESFSPSPILVKDSDSLMEEIDLFCTLDYPMPPGIEDDDYDSGRDILILKDFPSNNTLSFAEKESFHFDIHPFSRPPAKPPDGDTGILNIKMMGDISDQKAFKHKLMITLASHQEKSLDLLSHRGLKAFQPFATCPMMIHGQNNPILDVLLFHFYPP
nr:hypothetical protein [Tanacetum cinerariifolium]